MSGSLEVKTIEERYELLQALCRQQIMLNETLKSEVLRLGNLYLKVSADRSLLLTELLGNHSTCLSPCGKNKDGSPNQDKIKRHLQSNYRDTNQSKKPRMIPSPEVKPSISHTLNFSNTIPASEEMILGEQGLYTDQDDLMPRYTSMDRSTISGSSSSSCAGLTRPQTSRLQNLASQLNAPITTITISSEVTCTPVLTWPRLPITAPCSPPFSTVTSCVTNTILPSRPSKSVSLVTNSSVCSSSNSGGNIPFVPLSGRRSTPMGIQAMRSLSIPPRKIGAPVIPSISSPRAAFPVSVVMSPNIQTSLSVNSSKQIRSQSATTALRLSGSTPGQRILIQPSSTNVRSVLVQPGEALMSSLSDESQ